MKVYFDSLNSICQYFKIGSQSKLIKIDNQDLVQMKQDPVSNFIEFLRKISMIISAKDLGSSVKRDFQRYVIEIFYKRIIINPKVTNLILRQELNKVKICFNIILNN